MKPLSKGVRNARLAGKARRGAHHASGPVAAEDLDEFSTAWAETAAYASRLATARGQLIYEDMFKLMSLLDDLDSLAKAGATVDPELEEAVRRDVGKRIAEQRGMAAMVADDLVREENAAVWPFSELVQVKRK